MIMNVKRNKIKYCECGCGKSVRLNKHRFVHGHNGGHSVPHTELAKQKIREKRASQIFSEETNLKRNKSIKLKWSEPGYREKLHNAQLGKHFGCSEWAKNNLGRYKRTKEHRKHLSIINSGENCNFWKGGISYKKYPKDFNRKLKKEIRKRDSFVCQLCLKPQEELYEKLTIHHIDYNKKNNEHDNLISICRNCHASTNENRDQWQSIFAIQ